MSKILITQAIARGWCSPKNSHKILDVDLAVAIADEIMAALTPADEVVRDAARWRFVAESDDFAVCDFYDGRWQLVNDSAIDDAMAKEAK